MRRVFVCTAMLLLAHAAEASDAPHQLGLTVYNNNLALVQDVRRLDVPAGRTRVEFKDVSASIKPETVTLAGKGLSVVEQNFDYDLLTPAMMMEKAIGKQIQVVRTIPGTGKQAQETATVLSVNEGVVLRIGNRIEVLRDDGIPTRVVFASIPENLRAQPTLSVTVDAASGGPREATLSYLTTGLSWKADYVALFDEKRGALDLQGWVTLTNQTGTSFKDSKTQLVAGDVNITGNANEYWQQRQMRATARTNGVAPAAQTAVADYYVYQLPERVTVANNQTKQVSFIDLAGVEARKAYEYKTSYFTSEDTPEHADVVVKFSNGRTPLPAGIMRVYMHDAAGEPKFVGESDVDHTPAGSDLSVKIGEAFDVTVQPAIISSERIAHWQTRYQMSYVFHSALATPVTVDFKQGGLWRDAKVEHESLPSHRIDAYTIGWSVPVAPGADTTLTFTVNGGR